MKKLFSTRYSDNSFNFALLILRVVAGGALAMHHGLDKMKNFNAILAKGFVDPFHIGQSASLSLTIFAELFCAALVAVGLLTRLATIPVIICMAVAFILAHHGDPKEGESALIYLTIFLGILFVGPGKVSVDRLIAK